MHHTGHPMITALLRPQCFSLHCDLKVFASLRPNVYRFIATQRITMMKRTSGVGGIPQSRVWSHERLDLLREQELPAGLGIQSLRKKPTDVELPLGSSDRPQGPWHILLRGTCGLGDFHPIFHVLTIELSPMTRGSHHTRILHVYPSAATHYDSLTSHSDRDWAKIVSSHLPFLCLLAFWIATCWAAGP